MFSRSQAKLFFVVGTALASIAFVGLTFDTFQRIPAQTNQQNLSPEVAHGKELWEFHNCMGCHTILGEGGYYAPELTKVFERRGPNFIRAMLRDPEAMYPGKRKMQQYKLKVEEEEALIAFLKWVGEMDLNGFPPKPQLVQVAVQQDDNSVAKSIDRPKVYNQMCIACHKLEGQGGAVGPALDGIGSRMGPAQLHEWLVDPPKVRPGTAMPKLPLSEADITELVAFLSQYKEPTKAP